MMIKGKFDDNVRLHVTTVEALTSKDFDKKINKELGTIRLKEKKIVGLEHNVMNNLEGAVLYCASIYYQ